MFQDVFFMRKEFEINEYIEVPIDVLEEEIFKKFIQFVELNNQSFADVVNEIIDGEYIKPDGSKEK